MHCGFCVGALWFEVEWIWVGWDFAAARSTEPALLPSDPSWAWSLTNPGIASHRMVILPKPTQNTTSFPPLCLLSWLFGNLSISPTPVLGPRGSQFVVADLCWSWNLKVGVFWNLSKTGNNYHSTISLTIFQGNFWTKISFLDKHLIETNTVSSFPQNFHWLDALKYPPWHRHDICH